MIHLRRPLVAALLAFLAGLLLALRFSLPSLPPALLFIAALAALGLRVGVGTTERDAWDRTILLLLFASSGLIVGLLERRAAEGDCRARLGDGVEIELHGVLGAPHRSAAGTSAPLLPLLDPRVAGVVDCGAEVRVRLPAGQTGYEAGAAVAVHGRWRHFAAPLSPTPWPKDPRFHGFLLADSVVTGDSTSHAPVHIRLRGRTARMMGEVFPSHLPIVEALVLGRREYMDPVVRDRFERAGLAHLLAISGMHVGLIAGSLLLMGAAFRLPRRRGVAITLGLVWIYLIVIGAPASALRAGVMISLALLGSILQRPAAPLAILAGAALVILGLRPLAILDPGFQLSFAGILGILALRSPLIRMTPRALRRRGILRNTIDAFLVGVAASLATAPIVAHHFEVAAPVAIFSGPPAVPLMNLALIGTGAALAAHPVAPALAELFAGGAALALDALDRVAELAARVPFGNGPVPRPPWWSWSVAAIGAILADRVLREYARRLRKIGMVGVALAILVAWPLLRPGGGTGGVEVHFIDVGQGDAVAIRSPAGRWILVDAGPAFDGFDAGADRVLPFLRARGARRVEALVLTHPDLDHIGGAPAILRGIPVGAVFEPGQAVGRMPYLNLLTEVEQGRIAWRAARSGRTLSLDGIRMEILWPAPETVDVSSDANEISAVLRVSYGAFSLLLTGDVGVGVERTLIELHGPGIRSQVLKLGHHGSATSSAEEFLDAVAPDLAVVSAGRRNRYGHPAPIVMSRVETRGIPVARTDLEGTISLVVLEGGAEWRRATR